MVFVVENVLMIVSRSQGRVLASSKYPPQMSTTGSPSIKTAADAPMSAPLSRFLARPPELR
jgi:hypothetical protein